MYMKDRILKVMQKEGLSNAEFAEKIGISTSSLSHIFSGRNKPSLEVVMRIHKACPYININWLLYGEGEMEESAPAVTGMDLFSQPLENPKNTTEEPAHSDFRKENEVPTVVYPPKEIIREEVKYIENRIRRLPKYVFSSTTAPTRCSNPKNKSSNDKKHPPRC